MADDVAAAVMLKMNDAELAAYVADLGERLGILPQGDARDRALVAYGRACAEFNARGLPDGK